VLEGFRSLGLAAWGLVSGLIGLAVFVVVGIPLGNWFWGWLTTEGNALALIAAALVAFAVNHLQAHKE